jgi:hypothetical protein
MNKDVFAMDGDALAAALATLPMRAVNTPPHPSLQYHRWSDPGRGLACYYGPFDYVN